MALTEAEPREVSVSLYLQRRPQTRSTWELVGNAQALCLPQTSSVGALAAGARRSVLQRGLQIILINAQA